MAFMAAALPYIAAATAVAGTAISAIGAVNSGAAEKQAADYNAQVARIQAENAQAQATAQAQQVDVENRKKIGTAMAEFGAGGVDAQGSPLDVMSDLTTQGELSRQLTLYAGKVQAQSDTQQAALDTLQGSSAAKAGAITAGSTLLTGASNVGFKLQPFLTPNSAGTSPAAGP